MTDDDDRKVQRWALQTLFFDSGNVPDESSIQRRLDAILHRNDEVAARRRHRRWTRWVAVGGGAIVIAGGAVAAAALLRSEPTRPEAGTFCRAAATVDADAVEIAAGNDPIAGCEELWESGRFGTGSVPPLIACISDAGSVDVFPGDQSHCEALGLLVAETSLSPENQAVVDLSEQISEEINLGECRPVTEVIRHVESLLAESGLIDWRVQVEPGSETGVCGKAAVDSAGRTITVHEF